jgi:hypothetical protein
VRTFLFAVLLVTLSTFVDSTARITANGFQVRNDIAYGGTITDTGIQYFDERRGGSGAPQ